VTEDPDSHGSGSPRIAMVEDPGAPGDEVFSRLLASGRPIPNLYKVLANAPVILKSWVDFAWPLRNASAQRGLRELAVAYLAIRRDSQYVRTHHSRYARRHGVSSEQIEALTPGGWDSAADFSDHQRLVLSLVDDVVRDGAATAVTVASLQEQLGRQQTVELVVTVAFYEAVCVVNRSFDIPVEPGSTR
jgi:4-carboxymuconolactone decarboxylase